MGKRWMVGLRGRGWLAVATVVVVASLMPSPASAARFECGDEITGTIVLRNNLSGCQFQGLIVGADNITINLNGKTITGNGIDNTGVDAGIDNSAGHTGVNIKGRPDLGGDRIRGFEQGILVQGGTTQNTIKSLTTSANTVGVQLESSGNTVKKVKALNNVDDGIVVFAADSNTIQLNTVNGNDDMGIVLTDDGFGDAPTSNQVLENVVTANNDEGIHLQGASSNTVARNVASANGRVNDEDGIDLDESNGNTIESNTTNGHGEDGLDLNNSDNNTFRSNKATKNADDGLDVTTSDSNTFETNKLNLNGDEGAEQDSSDGNTYQQNTASDNKEDGLDLHGSGTVVNQNVVKRNGFPPSDNDGLGIDATGDPTVTGAGNIAVDNDDPAQCDPSALCA